MRKVGALPIQEDRDILAEDMSKIKKSKRIFEEDD